MVVVISVLHLALGLGLYFGFLVSGHVAAVVPVIPGVPATGGGAVEGVPLFF